MIKAISIFTYQRSCQLFHRPNISQSFSSQKPLQINPKVTYPYLFGGGSIKGQMKNNEKTKLLLQLTFDKDIFNSFKQAYRSIVHSIARNDIQTLKDILEPNLLNHFNNQSVQLLNPNADIEITCGKALALFDSTFIRYGQNVFIYAIDQQMIKLARYVQPQFNPEYIPLDFYFRADSILSKYQIFASDVPVLLSFQMFFKSKMKLIPKSDSIPLQAEQNEAHSVQFEIQMTFNTMKVIKKMLITKFSPNQIPENPFHAALGQNYEWKIGDIDRLLQGNFHLIR